MAKGNRNKKFSSRKRPKNSKGFKSKVNKEKNKSTYKRDIKHFAQRTKILESNEKKRVAPPEDNDEDIEEAQPDALQQLLSTFSDRGSTNSNVIESDESADDSDDNSIHNENLDHSDIEKSEQDAAMVVNEGPIDSEPIEDDESGLESETEPENKLDNERSDPFSMHFSPDLDSSLLSSITSIPKKLNITQCQWPILGELKVEIPIQEAGKTVSTLLEEQELAKEGKVPDRITQFDPAKLYVRPKIAYNIANANSKLATSPDNDGLTAFQKELFSVISQYQDLLYPELTHENSNEVIFTYCIHVINHVLKTRLKVIHNNQRLLNEEKEKTIIDDDMRDQGLVRPKVLILVPFRHSCYRIVNVMCSILQYEKGASIINKARFVEEFSGSELFMPKKNRKPEDFEKLFSGNVDDSFRIGLSFTKKSLRLYADFYSADVIIASPLGLRMVVGAEGERDRDFDFLASIEVLILDQADVFLMQNWDHVTHLLDHLHMQPRESHGTDFSRVRTWALNGWTQHYRQTILLSSISSPELNSVLSKRCTNYAGAVRIVNSVAVGAISRVVLPLPHVYRRFNCDSVVSSADERFRFFVEDIWPQFSELSGVLLYVASYFDYVRLRNHLKNQDISFVQICEYSKDGKVARARDMFYHNETRLLLYSERFHFFRRINIKGIRHIIFFQPPTFPHFYSELCNMMQESNQNQAVEDGNHSVTILFSKYDAYQLAAIIRTPRASRIISSDKSVHMFTTGQPIK